MIRIYIKIWKFSCHESRNVGDDLLPVVAQVLKRLARRSPEGGLNGVRSAG